MGASRLAKLKLDVACTPQKTRPLTKPRFTVGSGRSKLIGAGQQAECCTTNAAHSSTPLLALASLGRFASTLTAAVPGTLG